MYTHIHIHTHTRIHTSTHARALASGNGIWFSDVRMTEELVVWLHPTAQGQCWNSVVSVCSGQPPTPAVKLGSRPECEWCCSWQGDVPNRPCHRTLTCPLPGVNGQWKLALREGGFSSRRAFPLPECGNEVGHVQDVWIAYWWPFSIEEFLCNTANISG